MALVSGSINCGPQVHVHFHQPELAALADVLIKANPGKLVGANFASKEHKKAHCEFMHSSLVMSLLKKHCTPEQVEELDEGLTAIQILLKSLATETNKKVKKEKTKRFIARSQTFTGLVNYTSQATFSNLCSDGETGAALEFQAACNRMNMVAPDYIEQILVSYRFAQARECAECPQCKFKPDMGSLAISDSPTELEDPSLEEPTPVSKNSSAISISATEKGAKQGSVHGPKHVKTQKQSEAQEQGDTQKQIRKQKQTKASKASKPPSAVADETPTTMKMFCTSLMRNFSKAVLKNAEATVEDDLENDMDQEIDECL